MKLKNICLEFYNKVLPLIGTVSVALLITNFIVRMDLSFILSAGVIFVILTYYLNNKILAKYMSMKSDKIIFYVVNIIETTIFGFILRLIIDSSKYGEICLYCLFRAVGIIIIGMTLSSAIIYFTQKAYTKRMNKKLDEYKQKNDDK